jgi:hypothetical protein
MTTHLTTAEHRAVCGHREKLAESRGAPVSFEEALQDWTAHHAAEWRRARQEASMALQRQEIQRHKWIESEKAQRDLGGAAVMDWIRNHAAGWRDAFEKSQA